MEPWNPTTWDLTGDQKAAGAAVAAGALAVIVISLALKRARKLLVIGMIGVTATAAWWWASAHGVIDQVHSLINGR
jgi:hypothetical protein